MSPKQWGIGIGGQRLSNWRASRRRRVIELTSIGREMDLFWYFPLVKSLREEAERNGWTPELKGKVQAIAAILSLEQPEEFSKTKFYIDIVFPGGDSLE